MITALERHCGAHRFLSGRGLYWAKFMTSTFRGKYARAEEERILRLRLRMTEGT